ncbi:proprotein convertase P-domain-containing protein [Aquabacterium sp.]|uniref:proprotein convertase P-domain-containing protein n=1 Tax=Aquabacterium sp. TaxID=1872578 RepID=UPI002C3BBC60|nr:proprotein convertase P-domain-containing protein [Aquabacterium sp.]HSW05307.1 proprotein convertase P-domain-containing protein [Aquabacterium sp.]
MPTAPVYTYRAGQRLDLTKRDDQFVVRAHEPALAALASRDTEQVSAASTRVRVAAADLENQMAAARQIAPTHHAYDRADTGSEFLITDRVLVSFRPGTPQDQVDALIGRHGLVVKQRYDDRNYLLQLTDHTGVNPVKLVVALSENEPIVERAENDLNQRMPRSVTLPTDAHYQAAWHLHLRSAEPAFDARASARCEQAWQLLGHLGSAEVVIAVSDDGCRLDHADFNSPTKFAGWAYLSDERLVKMSDPDATPAGMYQPGANHGTSCAGVAAGEADGVMTVGAAPGCRLLPIKWESDDRGLYVSDSKLLTVLNWIADKADVLSNSWGIVPINSFAGIVTDRIATLSTSGGRRGRGIVFLWAAGNENCPIQHTTNVDVPYTRGWALGAGNVPVWVGVQRARVFSNPLVALPGVMHIAALASNARRSHYSNYGTGIDLCAPTNNSHTYRRLQVTGLGVAAPTGEGTQFTLAFGGTSSATPLVAGVAALVISAHPLLSAAEVISLLRRTASKDLDATPYPRTPPANFDPNPTWDVSPAAPFAQGEFANIGHGDGSWSPWFGFGRVDAERAVAAALAAGAPQPDGGGSSASSSRVIDIPDNDPTGIDDSVQLAAAGTASALTLSVDIRHSFIGDLQVSLVAPDGREAMVHNRSGGDQHDLARSWQSSDNPGLATLRGATIAGTWRLRVRDIANLDSGQLRGWSLAVAAQATQPLVIEESPGTTIPDNNPQGITRTLVAASTARVGAVELALDITHTYIGDLRVELVAPSGRGVVVHERSGRDADNLIRDWNSTPAGGLAALVGEAAGGNWTLKVADLDARDEGKLNRWRLRLSESA